MYSTINEKIKRKIFNTRNVPTRWGTEPKLTKQKDIASENKQPNIYV